MTVLTTGLFLTKNTTPVLSQCAAVLGWIINAIFNIIKAIGFPNVALAIILFTIVVYTLMIPLTYRQQKFTRMSARMNPEIQAIQNKYKGKNDQVSMTKMQDEMKAVYAKYGTSQTGSCLPLLIQLPILFAVYRVVYAIPAYVTAVKNAYYPLVEEILAAAGGSEYIQNMSSAASFSKQDFTLENTIIDVLNRASTTEWDELAASFPDLSTVIESTRSVLESFNSFLGLNISNSPWYCMQQSWSAGQYGLLIIAVAIPVLAGLSQWISIKISSNANQTTSSDDGNDMMKSMNAINNFMPLLSVYMCAILPVGVGLYWVMSAVVRTVQQVIINKQLEKMDIDEEIKKNIEKYNRKRAKNGLPPEKFNEVARTNTKTVNTSAALNKREVTSEDRQKQIKESTEYYNKGEAKPGSLAAKARMVEQYNQKNDKGKKK